MLCIVLGVAVSKDRQYLISTFKRQCSGINRKYMKRENENITKGIVYVLNGSMGERLPNVSNITGGSQTQGKHKRK